MADERQELQRQIDSVKQQLDQLAINLASAFEKNEDGAPMFVEHKLYHKSQRAEEESVKEKRSKLINDVTTWLVLGGLGALFTFLYTNYGALAKILAG